MPILVTKVQNIPTQVKRVKITHPLVMSVNIIRDLFQMPTFSLVLECFFLNIFFYIYFYFLLYAVLCKVQSVCGLIEQARLWFGIT